MTAMPNSHLVLHKKNRSGRPKKERTAGRSGADVYLTQLVGGQGNN